MTEILLGDLYRRSKKQYRRILSPITIEVLISHSLGRERTFLFAHPEYQLSEQENNLITRWLEEAAEGKPLAYITGKKEFYGFEFQVNNAVLIPRPETEGLVDQIIAYARQEPGKRYQILEIGTGSGAIAISLALILPESYITAIDISQSALSVAQENAFRLGVFERIHFHTGDLFKGIQGKYEIIVANLPYIARDVLTDLPVAEWEPLSALDGGNDGLDLFRRFFVESVVHLTNPAFIALEIGWDQGDSVLALARDAYPDTTIKLHQDLAGRDRVLTISR